MHDPNCPTMPGIDALLDSGRLLIPVDVGRFAHLPAELSVDGIALRLKHEFHVTVLNEDSVTLLGQRLKEEPQLRSQLDDHCARLSWQWECAYEHWLVRYQPPDEPLAHSVILLIDMPAANSLRRWLDSQLNMALGPVPAHITLYVAGREKGIGLANMTEFQARAVRRLELHQLLTR